MDVTLEKIDQVRSRLGVSYKEARQALEQAGGDVVQALVILEERGKSPVWTERVQVRGSELLDKIKQLLHEGNITRIVVKQGENVVAEIPVTVGAVGAVVAPYLAAIGIVAALATRCTIEFERKGPGKSEDAPVTDPVTFPGDEDEHSG
ncbi:MAG: DUF4342 domain-containing protein [Firmicutes bacterium]|nr:DUF4342 domain-containing protein [Bacillota bacterium]